MRARFDVRWATVAMAVTGAVATVACSNSDSAPSTTAASTTSAGTTSSTAGAGGAGSASSSSQSSSVQSVVASTTSGAGGGDPSGCSPAPSPGTFHALEDTLIGDVKPSSMCKYTGKVLFVFNAAELCGYTGQTTAIQKLQSTYEAKGLTVLGFYSNDFGNQGGNPETCNSKYGVTFDTFEIAPVKGANARPVFAWFGKQTSPGPEMTSEPQWNFSKYLVARDGTWAKHWSTPTLPDAKEVTDAIEAELAKK